jgi:hypothetical protein
MHIWVAEREHIQFIGDELKNNFEIRDGSREKAYKTHRIELSDALFPKVFTDGEQIDFHLEDNTAGRFNKREKYFGMEGNVFYRLQDKAVIITLGTSYDKGIIRENLKWLEKVWNDVCGQYDFYVEKAKSVKRPELVSV